LQALATQESTVQLLASSQVCLHAPQLGIAFNGASQPSAAWPLQSPKPELQLAIAQAPFTQAGAAFGRLHDASAPGSSIRPSQLLSMPSHISGPVITQSLVTT